MLTEIFIAFGVLAVGSGILIGVLALLYGKDRPTKMYLPVFPIMFFLAIVFFIFGKYGASNYTVITTVLAVITVAAIVNFVLIVTYKMRPVITSIHGITDRIGLIASASEEVVMASRSLAAGASEQASAVEETSSSLEQLSAMTRENAEHSAAAAEMNGHITEIRKTIGRFLFSLLRSGAVHEGWQQTATNRRGGIQAAQRSTPRTRKQQTSAPASDGRTERGTLGITGKEISADRFNLPDKDGEFKDF